MENKIIKVFEEQIQNAINKHLWKKESFLNDKGIKYYCAKPAANSLALHFSSQYDKDLLLTFINCATNVKPCLSGYLDLTLKKEGGIRFSRMRYYFHICTRDYDVISTNSNEIIVYNLSFLIKQGSRLY